jgi:hypothetical protein
MDLSNYPDVKLSIEARRFLVRELRRPGRDRRHTTLYRCLDLLDRSRATLYGNLAFESSVVSGKLVLGPGEEWYLET